MKGYNVGIEEEDDPVLQHGDNDVIVRARESSTTLNMRRKTRTDRILIALLKKNPPDPGWPDGIDRKKPKY